MCGQGTITVIKKTKTKKEIDKNIVRELSLDRMNADRELVWHTTKYPNLEIKRTVTINFFVFLFMSIVDIVFLFSFVKLLSTFTWVLCLRMAFRYLCFTWALPFFATSYFTSFGGNIARTFDIRYFQTFTQVLFEWVTFTFTKVIFQTDIFTFAPVRLLPH